MAVVVPRPKVAAKSYKRAPPRNISHGRNDFEEIELHHQVGPSAVDGTATGVAETRVSHHEVNHNEPRHVYQYLETNLSQLAGASRTSERSPVHEGSQINRVQVRRSKGTVI